MRFRMKYLKDHTPVKLYTLGEEIAHAVTHGIGAALSVAGLTLLVVLAVLHGDIYQMVSFSIYGATLFVLYLASTLYHSFQHPEVKHVFRILDHMAIFLLIAGTYTPFLLVGIRGPWGWTLLVIIWGMAILGIAFKVLFIRHFERVSVLAYVLMGWLGVVAFRELWTSIPTGGLVWLGMGGAAYTIGILFYAMEKKRYSHAIWHLFVLGGSICHYLAILLYLAPLN